MDYLSEYEVIDCLDKSDVNEIRLVKKKDADFFYIVKIISIIKENERNEYFRRRYHREIDILTSLDHPNISKPIDIHVEKERVIIIYPYYKGKTLEKILSERRVFNEEEACNITKQLLEALIYIHNRGVIHADINPNNIFISDEKGLKLLDFGYAITEDEAKNIPEGNIIGTFPYLSPEQMGFTGFKIDNRSDLYCVGVILYKMLSGNLPFHIPNNSIKELIDAELKREIEPLKNVIKTTNEILLKGLRPSPIERYQTAEGFLYDIERCIENVKKGLIDEIPIGRKDAILAVNRKRLFVVREKEIGTLINGVEKLDAQEGRYYLLYGKSGIGKTEIVREFRSKTDNNRYDFLSAKCNRFTPAIPFSVIRQILTELYLKIEQTKAEEINELTSKIREELADFSGVICNIVPELKPWFKKVLPLDEIEKEKETDRIIHVMSLLFETICKKRRIILFVDDLQWIDRISFYIINRIISKKIACMIICNYRTGTNEEELYYYTYDLREIGFTKTIPIHPFTKKETEQLLNTRFNRFIDRDEFVDLLYDKTDGVPFVIMEAIRFLLNKDYLFPVNNEWFFKKDEMLKLPGKFDLLSMMADKINSLAEGDRKILETASLIEGKFDENLLYEIAGTVKEDIRIALSNLGIAGLITPQLTGGYAFAHDKIQESTVAKIPGPEKYKINEKLGEYYLIKAEKEKENLFRAAEYYLKSKNYRKSIDICYKAALYATEKNALDVAIKYYKNTIVMYKFAEKEGIKADIDIVNLNMEYGKVLMLTGANNQALNLFTSINNNDQLSEMARLEIMYLIGTIYNNLGEFEKSIPCYISILNRMGVKLPNKRIILIVNIISEVIVQFFYSIGIKKFIRKIKDPYLLIMARTFSKLTVSLYFYDMFPCFFIHFKSLNLADKLENCYEKCDIYSTHQVPIYQLMLKKRALKYLNEVIKIASSINRIDCIAYAQCLGGMVQYYYANWKKGYDLLTNSIKIYQSLGDLNNQLMSSEHIWKIKFNMGNMVDTYKEMIKTIELCKKVNDQSYLLITASDLELVQFLIKGKIERENIREIERQLNKSDLIHIHIEVGESLLNLEIETNDFQKAYDRGKKLLKLILQKSINSEYQVRGFSLFCTLICRELRNRLKGITLIPVHEKRLKAEFIKNGLIHWFSCLSYPAYWGALYRNIAWYLAVNGLKWPAHFFFKKAIQNHHKLDMRYEEACSIRDYGYFLEEFCNLPGRARDQFTKAYEIFRWCGAKLETDRLEGYIHPGSKIAMEEEADTTGSESDRESGGTSSSGVNMLRFETLVEVSKTITETDDPSVLMRQILSAMITATGAQYGSMFINRNVYEGVEPIAMSYEGKDVPVSEVQVFKDLVDKVDEIHQMQITNEQYIDNNTDTDAAYIRSDLCVPLNWRDKYLGYVYLVNDRVSGLFGEGAQKSALVLAAQAGILLENAALMKKQKEFNRELQQHVEAQTKDIIIKNKQLEEANLKLIESERMKGILSGTIVHDIKNYTAGITGNLIYLQRRMQNDPKAQRVIEVVCEACSDIMSMASNLLDIAKMDDGKLVVKKEPMDYHLLKNIAEKFTKNSLFEEKEIIPKIIPPEDEFIIFADVYLMERVMQNLYSNAAKYACKGSSVELRFYRGENENIICFFNSGTPIPDSEKDIIFEKYARLNNRQSHYSKGLGLFFCKMVMQAHGGRIWLDTDQTGNYFKLALPGQSFFKKFNAAS